MTTYELSEQELDELREALYWDLVNKDEDGDFYAPFQIEDEILHSHYAGVDFVKDDFWCNQKEVE